MNFYLAFFDIHNRIRASFFVIAHAAQLAKYIKCIWLLYQVQSKPHQIHCFYWYHFQWNFTGKYIKKKYKRILGTVIIFIIFNRVCSLECADRANRTEYEMRVKKSNSYVEFKICCAGFGSTYGFPW